jgi:HSP20 family protein
LALDPRIDTLFAEAVANLLGEHAPSNSAAAANGAGDVPRAALPPMLVRDTGSAYEVQALMPGVSREQLNVTIDGSTVSIDGLAATAFLPRQGETLLYSDPIARRYARRFELPQELKAEQCSAKLDNGVLTLILPKRMKDSARTVVVG